ncbi:outer membrane protein [Qipengyuania zhejiangensis]|uniref:outer membrane protein n=1 Tax=Qipengyuania zhejiangensis TaxID=3077782 RepID=UPI002D77081C|nr:outer membrane beta-barrel protein [Qipengyuania sp. Z2]
MKKTILFAASIAAASLASPVMAQDSGKTYFDGVYVGGTFGLDAMDDNANDRLVFDTDGDGDFDDNVRTVTNIDAFSPGFCNGQANGATRTAGCRDDKSDFGYAVRIGFDKRLGDGPIVAGLLVEGAMSDSVEYTSGFSTTPASYTLASKLDKSVAVRGRLGFSPGNGQGLFYVTGGVAYGDIEHEFTTTNTANSFDVVGDDKWRLGGQIGGGAELMLTDNISWGLEYLYSRYDDDKASVLVGPGTAGATNPFLLDAGQTNLASADSNFDIHSIRTSLSFRF